MNLKAVFFCVFAIFLFLFGTAQDIHYTNYHFAPLSLNPANTGDYSGSYRIGIAYREQFSNFSTPYRTPSLFMDSPLAGGLRKNHWIGAGISFSLDRTGDLSLQNSSLAGNIAYHIGWGKNGKQNISLGFQMGQISRSTPSGNKAVFGDIWTTPQSKDQGLIDNFKGNALDYNAGANFDRKVSEYSKFTLGVAILHIQEPKIKFKNGQVDNPIPRRMNVYTSYGIDFSDQISLIPRAYFSTANKNYNTNIQLLLDYRLYQKSAEKIKTPAKVSNIQFGLGYRLKDAIQMIMSITFKNWLFGAAYDYTVSQLPIDSNSGAIEIGVQRTVTIAKKPKVNPKVFCPRF